MMVERHRVRFLRLTYLLLSAFVCAASSNSSAAASSDEEAILDCAALVKARRYAEAIPVCTGELLAQQEKKNGITGDLTVLRATAYAAEGQAMKALSDFEAALKEATATSSDAAHLGRAQIYLRQGRFNDAHQDIKALAKETPESKEVKNKIDQSEKRFEAAQKLFEGGHFEKANAAFERLQLDDHLDLSKMIYTMRAKCLTKLGRYMDAIRMYQGRSTLELESSETEYEVGRLYLALGNLDKGRKLIDDCARSNPDHRASLALRKRLKAITATIDEADKMLIKQAVAALEEALKQSSNIDPAEPYYDEALAPLMLSKPFELPILKLLCSKHIRLKQTDLALERCQRVLDLSSTSSTDRSKNEAEAAFLSLGEAYVMAEKYEEALNLLKQAQRAFPRSQRVNEALQKASADLRKSKQKDYYKIIGVPKDASESDIRRAYNKAARRWHPDKQTDESKKAEAVAKMQELNAALTILTDKKKRAQFDAGIDPEDPQGGAGHHGGGGPFGGHGGPFGGHGGGGGFHFNFEDLFRQQQQQQQRRGHGGHGGGYRRQHQGGGQRFEDFFKFDL